MPTQKINKMANQCNLAHFLQSLITFPGARRDLQQMRHRSSVLVSILGRNQWTSGSKDQSTDKLTIKY